MGLGRVLGVCLAWMRLTGLVQLRRPCRRYAFGLAVPLGLGWMHGRVDVLRIRWTLMSPFPLTNNRPLSEGAAGASRLGEGRYIEKPSGPADAQPVLRECSLWQLWLPG